MRDGLFETLQINNKMAYDTYDRHFIAKQKKGDLDDGSKVDVILVDAK